MKTLEIKVKGNKAFLVGDYPKKLVDNLTSSPINGFQFSPMFRRKMWDGKRHLLNKFQGSIPLGLLTKVALAVKNSGVDVSITVSDEYTDRLPVVLNTLSLVQVPDMIGTITLRDYQKDAMLAFLNPVGVLPYYSIIKCGTGGGKTVISAALAKLLNVKTLFLVRGKALKDQTYDVYKMVLDKEDVGRIDSSHWEPDQFTIASVDTLYSRLKGEDAQDVKDFLKTIDFLIVDEAHTATSASFMAVLNCISAYVRLGLSGTPLKKDPEKDLLLEAFCGPISCDIPASKLQDEGHLAKAWLSSVIIDSPKLNALNYVEAKDTLIINNTARTNILANIIVERYNNNKTIMVLAGNSVALGENLHAAIQRKISKKKDAVFVYGKTDNAIVNKALDNLRKGKIKILISTVIFDVGVDVPAISCLVVAGGGKSFVKTLQRVGRGLRKKVDGGMLEVIDCMDTTNHYLLSHSKKRIKYYEEEDLFEGSTILDLDKYRD
jgi:superfamily II DNA or RNA helicase